MWAMLFRYVGILLIGVSAGLVGIGIPISALFLAPPARAVAACLWMAGCYLVTAIAVHLATWERLEVTYPTIRAPMLGSLTFMMGTAAVDTDVSVVLG